MRDPQVLGQFTLERRHLAAENELPGIENPLESRLQLLAQKFDFGLEIQIRDTFHQSSRPPGSCWTSEPSRSV